jgi:hypothetical protein
MLHAAIRSLYAGFIGKTLNADTINGFMQNRPALSELVRSSVDEVLKREQESFAAINEMMVREVLLNYVLRILEIDRSTAPFTILSIEESHHFHLTFKTESGSIELIAGGNIDRVDIKNGTTRVVDYKTGKAADTVSSLSALFEDDRDKELDAWLQTLIYCEAYLAKVPGAIVRPSVYKLKKTPGEKITDKLILNEAVVEDYNLIRQAFLEDLGPAVSTIFSSSEPFVMTRGKGTKCIYCPFRVLCGR